MQRSRLRGGEVVAGAGALALLALTFLVPWYGGRPGSGGARRGETDGWNGLPVLRWLVLVAAIAALFLVFTQATRRAPALPVTMSVIVTVLGGLTVASLIYELIANAGSPQPGAFAGLLSAVGIAVGGFRSLRTEQGWLPGRDHPIETISIGSVARRPRLR